MKSALIAASLITSILATPAFAGGINEIAASGQAQPTASVPTARASHADSTSQKTRADVNAELKAYRDSGAQARDTQTTYFGH
jgi:hypothetical protein